MNLPAFVPCAVVVVAVLCLGCSQDEPTRSEEPAFHLQKTPAEWAQLLRRGLEEGNLHTTRLAALALRSHGRLDSETVQAMEQILRQHASLTEPVVRPWPAAEVLAEQGADGIPALVSGLAPLFDRMTEAVDTYGTNVYFPLDPDMTALAARLPEAVATPLAHILEDEGASQGERAAAASLLAGMHPVVPDRALLSLLRVLGDEEQPTAVRVLCESGVLYAVRAHRLCDMAADSEEEVVKIAALWFANRVSGSLDPLSAADTLEPLLSSANAHVRVLAAAVLLRAHCHIGRALSMLLDALDAEDEHLVARAAIGLGVAGASAISAVSALEAQHDRWGEAGTGASTAIELALQRIKAATGE